jgi:hypothetical protein
MTQVLVHHLAPETKLLVLELGISADPQLVWHLMRFKLPCIDATTG